MTTSVPSPIFTIGYGNRPWDEVVELLRRCDVAYVLDVRSRPFSRFRPEFRHDLLRAACARAGLHYAYMGQALGGVPSDPTLLDASGNPDYGLMRVRPAFVQALERLQQAHADGHRCALLCGCLRPNQCHRGRLLGPELVKRQVPVQHITAEGGVMSQAEMEHEETGGQSDLFG